MITKGYIWLSSPESMNDKFEKEVIKLSKNKENLYFTSFSRTEENIAMYKMYAPEPDGAMLCMSYDDAKTIITKLEKLPNGKPYAYIVRDGEVTEDTVEANVFWSAVAYKGLRTDTIISGTVSNSHISKPLKSPDLAGLVKLYGWQYENEVRLCATTSSSLKGNEKLAIQIPEDIRSNLEIVLCPNFDKTKNRNLIVELKANNNSIVDSDYDQFVNFGFTELDTIKELRNEIESKDKQIKELKKQLNEK